MNAVERKYQKCTFVNDVRQSCGKKEEQDQNKLSGWMEAPWEATEGVAEGDSQGGAAVRWPPVACAFEWAKASREPAWECDWNGADIVASV